MYQTRWEGKKIKKPDISPKELKKRGAEAFKLRRLHELATGIQPIWTDSIKWDYFWFRFVWDSKTTLNLDLSQLADKWTL